MNSLPKSHHQHLLGQLVRAVSSMSEDTAFVDSLIKLGIDVNESCNDQKNTALFFASVYNRTKMVTHLLSIGADPNIQNIFGDTPLHKISECRHDVWEVAELLLDAKAQVETRNERGNTPLLLALINCSFFSAGESLISTLLDHGADIFVKNIDGKSPAQIILGPGSGSLSPPLRLKVQSQFDKKVISSSIDNENKPNRKTAKI